ncbi:FAD-dependent oxidoreductase [Mycobacterium kyorinense]|uniref:FAD-dependent oxidoreductase n=1 Tax=Mycobacterium kyorinense TaxID=487514 RepID=A0A1A2ZD66_9MYCO|nr:FAD-dependent monooxygenase [Mycobacterium kyorinense]OBI47613.1 FAD-dependent oxidoreductase [Mycobacterium kyorinense]
MHENPADVVISGAGPTGLMVACELALGGVRPVVLDALPEPSAEPKANGLVGQVIRILDMRGLYTMVPGTPDAPEPIPGYMFSGMLVSFAEVADNPMYALGIQQPRLVRLLEQRARDLGVDIRWGHELVDLTQQEDGVGLHIAGPQGSYGLATRFLVGADGGRSLVRKNVGIEFPGSTAPVVGRLAHVSIPDELRAGDGGLDIPGVGRIMFPHNRMDGGTFIFAEFEPGRPLLGTIEFDDEPLAVETPMTIQEMRESLRRVLGVDLPVTAPQGPGPHALRRIDGQNTRQAERYRDGNVFLVGDAAHVHSAMGGPGLNLGLQDAVNLGWKLAAAVNGWAPTGLLDTYHSERHPVGQRVMMQSMSQSALMAPGPEVGALRTLFTELLAKPDVAAHIAHLLAGSDVRYDVGDSHVLSGRLIPDLTLHDGQRVAELMHPGRPVLLDLAGGAVAESAVGCSDRVTVVVAQGPESPAAMLIRPDGYVAWASDSCAKDDIDRLNAALRRWFAPAASDPERADSESV